MARLPRLTLPGHLHHAVQRGGHRQVIFTSDEDFRQMHGLLGDCAREAGVAVHAYVLLPDRFHVLATPDTDRGLASFMQAVGRRYVRWFNDRHGRSGTLWEGRYRSTVLQAERFLLPCMVDLDLAPVREGLVQQPGDYPWSSCRHYCGAAPDRLPVPHPLFWTLGNTPFAREQAYGELLSAGLPDEVTHSLERGTHRGWALGDPAFLDQLQRSTSRPTQPRTAGRPRKSRVDVAPIFEPDSPSLN